MTKESAMQGEVCELILLVIKYVIKWKGLGIMCLFSYLRLWRRMATALYITWLPGNKVAEDKDFFMNYNIKTHVNQITTGLQNDRNNIEKAEGFYIMDFV
jgi:hypothetical protein